MEIGIAKAASVLGVSITTLRRWGRRPISLWPNIRQVVIVVMIYLNYGLSCFGPPTEQSARRLATAVCHPTIKNPILSGKSKSWNFSVPGKAGRLTAGETRELANGCADRELLPARL